MKRSCNNVFGPSSYDDQLETCASLYTDEEGHECTTELSLKGDTTIYSVVQHCRQSVFPDKENIDLILQAEDNSKSILLSEHLDSRIRDLGIDMRLKYKILSLSQHQQQQQQQTQQEKRNMQLYVNDTVEDDLLLGASASPTTGELPSNNGDVSNLPIAEDDNDHSHCTRCRVNDANNINNDDNIENNDIATCSNDTTRYVGLVNQAMTCYLNSLVQALFMTPEFRNAIYNWEFDGQNETRSIPYQLQKLFLNLQTSTRSAVETTDLTTSFGWQGSEAWHQHDIQELCRVMFDALERKFKDTKQANLINDLYEGKMLDYVKCLECGTEKSREDTFLDIPLPVRPFGSNVAYNSVEEALRAFVQPETLDGNNQYHCEKCNKKCDAHKGLKFIKFPYLLTLHLKRFDFDYSTMHRIKLNDKVVFPEKLNLNSFVPNNNCNNNQNNSNHNNNSNNKTENETIEERDTVIKCDDSSTTDSGSALDDESCQGTDLSSAINDHDDNCEDSDEGIDVSSGNNHHENEAKGPYNYELFSIMIHSGSASGGHYYAYIKDLDRNCWLCFNDQSVTRITEDDIRKTYGGGSQKGYYSGVYTSSTNAYMLMYRQIDKERNCKAMKIDEFPQHIQNLLQHMRNKEKIDKINKEKQNNSTKITVNCYHPITGELSDIRMTMIMDSTLEDSIAMAYRRFKLDGLVAIEDCRMVVFNKKHQCIDCSFDSNDIKFCDIVNKYQIFYGEWLLEIKEPGTEFITYKHGGINVRVYYIHLENEDVREPVFVRVDVDDTVKVLKDKTSAILGIDSNNLKIIKERYCHEQYLDDDSSLVLYDNVSDFKLFVSEAFDEDPHKSYESSKMKKIIENFQYIVHIDVLLPDTDPVTLESLGVPLLEMAANYDKLEPERTNSPSLRISPQPGNAVDNFGDQSNSEDSISSDSDRTLVGDAPGENQLIFSSSSNSPADQHMTSPMDPTEDVYNYDVLGNSSEEMNWEGIPSNNPTKQQSRNYFKVTSIRECRKGHESTGLRLCKIFIDKRMTLEMFKRYLEPILKIPKEYFKIFKNSPTPDEEWSSLSDTFKLIRDGQMLTIKLGRALSRNEYNCKVYLLKLDNSEPTQFLFEHIINLQQTVGQAKKEIVLKAKKQHMLDIPYYKCRLREKYFKKPRKVYLDDQLFSDLIITTNNFEMFLQELNEPEKVTHSTKLVLFVRHWCPSTMTLQPFQEIVMETTTVVELKQKISEISNIPIENVEFAFVRNTFPFDMNLLDIHTELYWSPSVDHLEQWPIQADYGAAFFYRDNREKLKELTSEEKKEISIKENTRLGRVASRTGTTLEKSLRIYTDNWPSETEDNCID